MVCAIKQLLITKVVPLAISSRFWGANDSNASYALFKSILLDGYRAERSEKGFL